MRFKKGRHPGATWRKTDLQVHTPRDAGWSGSPSLAGGTPEFESARKAWARDFVAECLKRELGAISITDHHDVVMYPYVEEAINGSPDAKENLWLFPGMEVTCEDSVQCLILFDQGTPQQTIQRLFGMMPKVVEPPTDTAKAPQADVCGKDIRDFLGATFADAVLKGRSIVLPHASKAGHKDILRRGFHSRFAELEVDGVYNEKKFDDLDKPTLQRIYGESKEWGDRRRGIVTTGDNRHANYERLGAHACWIRLGEPTAEAIRQAVLADEARITYQQPSIPSQRVLALRTSSTLVGNDFHLVLNDGFNALIGGRGSGKSAVLEYLRFGLGRSTLDTDEDATSDRERDLIKSTLAGGFVEVDLERDGVKETWRRSLDRQSIISISSEAGGKIELPISSVHERFRARAFSQKQLSTMVRRLETADEQITGIAAAESVDLRRQSEQRIRVAEQQIRSAAQKVFQGWMAEAARDRAVAIANDLRQRVDAIRKRLEAGGLTPDQKLILDQHPMYARAESHFSNALRSIREKYRSTEQSGEVIAGGWSDAIEVKPVSAAKEAIAKANLAIQRAKDELKSALDNAQASVEAEYESFKVLHEEFKQKYDEASAAQEHLGSLLADYTRLSAELEKAEVAQRDAEAELEKFSQAIPELAKARDALGNELTTMRQVLSEAASRVEMMSNGTLRARVEEEKVPELFKIALLDLCERCGIRELEDRCAAKVEEANQDGRVGWETLIQKLMSVRRAVLLGGEGAELDPDLVGQIKAAFAWELTDNQAKSILGRLENSRLAQLLSVWASPFIRFEYKDRGTYMSFERASPGQQASALLTLLLNQEAGTLIIDQPEDDLDNKVIMTIVKLLQTTKRKRQLIFATHNPNFVVNGDADKVVALSPSVEPAKPEGAEAAQIEIETDGAIETPSVRRAITDTMEGGLEAFELRGRKYAFEPTV